MMAWEPVGNGTYHTDGPELVKVSDAKLSILRHNGNAYVDLQQGYALCRQVPDGGVIVTHDQLVLMQEAMRFAWEGFKLHPQYDQTATRMQRLDNWIGVSLTKTKGGG